MPGQLATDQNTYPITAIPMLLAMLNLKGGIVTFDAMGCPHEIARTLVQAKADDVLAVKNNLTTLHVKVPKRMAEAVRAHGAWSTSGTGGWTWASGKTRAASARAAGPRTSPACGGSWSTGSRTIPAG